MSRYIVKKIKSNETLNKKYFVRDEENNSIIDWRIECDCGSVNFNYDFKPAIMRFDSEEKHSQSFNLGLPLRRPYKWLMEFCPEVIPISSIVLKNINPKTITEFDIMAYSFGTNDMWEYLLDIIQEYYSEYKLKSLYKLN